MSSISNNTGSVFSAIWESMSSISTDGVSLSSIQEYGGNVFNGTMTKIQEYDPELYNGAVATMQKVVTNQVVQMGTAAVVICAGGYRLHKYGAPVILTYPLAALASVPSRIISLASTIKTAASSRWAGSAAASAVSVPSSASSLSDSEVVEFIAEGASFSASAFLTSFKDAVSSRVAVCGSAIWAAPRSLLGVAQGIASRGWSLLSYPMAAIQSAAASVWARGSSLGASALGVVSNEKIQIGTGATIAAVTTGWGAYNLYSTDDPFEVARLYKKVKDAEHLADQISKNFGLDLERLDVSNPSAVEEFVRSVQNLQTAILSCSERRATYDEAAESINQKNKDFYKKIPDQVKSSSVALLSKPLNLDMTNLPRTGMQLNEVLKTLRDCHAFKVQKTGEIAKLSEAENSYLQKIGKCKSQLNEAYDEINLAKLQLMTVCQDEFKETLRLGDIKSELDVNVTVCEANKKICLQAVKDKGRWFW